MQLRTMISQKGFSLALIAVVVISTWIDATDGHVAADWQSRRDNDVIDRLRARKLRSSKRGSSRVSFQECDLDPGVREDCGFYGIDMDGCYRRGCCFQASDTPGVPWCYHSKPTITPVCTMHVNERIDCGNSGTRKEHCLNQGCCWQPTNENGVPWCFQIKRVPIHTGQCGTPAIPPSVASWSRIVGGDEAIANSWPWQVSLQTPEMHMCGGSVINERWIVSAAHCAPAFRYGGGNVVVVGAHRLSDMTSASARAIEFEEMIEHENYNDNTYDNDIMLIKLREPIEFMDEISPICLPQPGEVFEAGLRCYTTGWGDLMAGGESPDMLQQVMVPIIGHETCNQDGWYNGELTQNMVCAGYEEGGRDSCQGDSGGPFVCYHDDTWKLVGVVSWGYGCASEQKPGIYTKVSNYVDWIQDKMSRYS